MRTTVELSDRTYTQLRARAAERGLRGFSAIVEEALQNLLEPGTDDEPAAGLAEAEGAWSAGDIEDWELARKEAWATWSADPSSTPTS
jgi:hypothetical protein